MLASCKLIFKTYISWLIDFHERWWKGREVFSSYSRNVPCVSLVEVVNFGLMMTWPSLCWCVSLLWLSTSEFSLWRRVEILLDAFPLLTKRITWLCPSFSCVLISSCRTFCIPGMNPKTSLLWLENYLMIDFWSFILSVWWKHGFLKFLMFTDQWPCLPIKDLGSLSILLCPALFPPDLPVILSRLLTISSVLVILVLGPGQH